MSIIFPQVTSQAIMSTRQIYPSQHFLNTGTGSFDMCHDLKCLEASPCYAVEYPQSSVIFHYLRMRTYNAIKIHESATAQCKRIPITAAERRNTQI